MMMLIIILNYINLPLDKMADDLFKCIFMNDKFGILIKISLKFVPKSPFDHNLALLIIACSRIGDKPLSEPGPCITNVFATRRKNFSQWHRSFQRKLRSHWLKFLRHVAKTLVIQGPVLTQ